MRLLDLALPFSFFLPEIELPYENIPVLERLAYTVGAGILYYLLSEVTLGAVSTAGSSADPIPWLRAPLGAAHGTPAELGVIPVVLSGAFFQILAGLRKISVNLELKKDRALFQSVQKIVAILISLVFAVLLAFAPGTFGAAHVVSSKTAELLLAAQIFLGSVVTIYLDEMLSKGYGFISGTVLFPLITSSQQFVWSLLSLESVSVPGQYGTSTYGVLPSLFFNLSGRSITYAVTDVAFRQNLPNLFDIVAGVVVFLGVLYVSMYRFNLQIRSTKMRAQSSSFPVRLLYTGNQPILLVGSVLAAYLLFSYALNNFLGPDSIPAQIFGVWQPAEAIPVSGLAALLVPTFSTSANVVYLILRTLVYPVLFAIASAYIATLWTASSGFAPADVAKTFKENSIVLVGKRETSAVKELRKIIPMAAALGGALVGAVSGAVDVVAPAGWGLTMSVAALNVLAVFEQLAEDGVLSAEGMPKMF